MAGHNYDAQILSLVAAASFGTPTDSAYGCTVTAISTGVYSLTLPTGEGLMPEQTFLIATAKATPSVAPFVLVASNVDQFTKVISCFANVGGTPVAGAVEIVVERSVINPLDTSTPPY